ncbi:hypothetical protein AUK22_00690 [bacterium CG2_30_54_10]|nr:MAG: hypothetical protein AUK22_00690 [bacterium CG2_30_54_10]
MNAIKSLAGKDHRKRMKERFDQAGLGAFSDHEILEFLLFYSIPRVDTKPMAKALLDEFRDLPGVFSATREGLLSISGLGPEAARFIFLFRDLSGKILQKKALGSTPAISTASDLIAYLGATMSNLPIEQFRVVFVNNVNRIIKDESVSTGTEDQTAVYPRQVMKRALAVHATGILVAHNHPTGSLRPSPADLEITRALAAAAGALEIRLLDHLILGREGQGYFSFRENGLIS